MQNLPKQLAEAIEGALTSLPNGEPAGYVYVVCAGGLYWKVGRAGNPEQRATNMRHACPFDLQLAASIPHATPYALEAEIQRRLAEFCHYGEWFAFDRRAVVLPPELSTLTLALLWALYEGAKACHAQHSIRTQENLDRARREGRKPGRRHSLTPELRQRAMELVALDYTLPGMAKELGVSESTLRRSGIVSTVAARRSRPQRRRLLEGERLESARALLPQVGLEETARRMGVSESTIRRRVMRVSPSSTSS